MSQRRVTLMLRVKESNGECRYHRALISANGNVTPSSSSSQGNPNSGRMESIVYDTGNATEPNTSEKIRTCLGDAGSTAAHYHREEMGCLKLRLRRCLRLIISLCGKTPGGSFTRVDSVQTSWDAFYGTQLETHLRVHEIRTLVVFGCNLPNCPRATLFGASSRDFCTVLVTMQPLR